MSPRRPAGPRPTPVIEFLQHLRSVGALLGVGVWFAACSPLLRLGVLPQAWLWPRRRLALVIGHDDPVLCRLQVRAARRGK